MKNSRKQVIIEHQFTPYFRIRLEPWKFQINKICYKFFVVRTENKNNK